MKYPPFAVRRKSVCGESTWVCRGWRGRDRAREPCRPPSGRGSRCDGGGFANLSWERSEQPQSCQECLTARIRYSFLRHVKDTGLAGTPSQETDISSHINVAILRKRNLLRHRVTLAKTSRNTPDRAAQQSTREKLLPDVQDFLQTPLGDVESSGFILPVLYGVFHWLHHGLFVRVAKGDD